MDGRDGFYEKGRKSQISRADLARRTGLTRASISLITEQLLSEGVILEAGAGEAELGRKPVLLEINPNF